MSKFEQPTLNRRRFLQTSAAAAAIAAPGVRALAQAATERATLTLHPERSGAMIPHNFVGLSYESEELHDASFFSPENTGLIAQFRALNPHGVLRIGGNTSDVGWWKPTPGSQPPPMHTRIVTGEPNSKLAYSIAPEAIRNLRGFLDATGWTCIFGLNLGTGTPAMAADEAGFVDKTLGSLVEYFQIGNEPDLFKSHMRDPKTWSPDVYLDEWLTMADAVRARVPSARFGLPDTAGNPEWSSRIAQRLSAMPKGSGKGSRPPVAAITHHYYFGGPPSNPEVNIHRLLQTDPRVARVAATTRAAADELATSYRMTEGNTCYRGGKPGVSDVFASSLWAADYLLSLAAFGYAGANLHGGSAASVGNSLGGHLPGDDLVLPGSPPQPRPYYTPIADMSGTFVAEPVYFGMLFAGFFAGGTIVPIDFQPGPVNATAYAAKLPTGQFAVAIINKDEVHDLPVNLPGYSLAHTLSAPALSARSADLTEPARYREAAVVRRGSAVILLASRG